MDWWQIALIVLASVVLLMLIMSFVLYMVVFYKSPHKMLGEGEYEYPPGRVYEPHKPRLRAWVDALRAMPHEDFYIKSHDGLSLRGSYYECQKGAPIEIMFHGYGGYGERDGGGAIERCFKIGHNALLIDQRGCGLSQGKTTTFGIKERFDCVRWAEFVTEHFGKETKIMLSGISMGAATVLMAAGENLPKNVVCVLADCGYSSPKEIIKTVIRKMKLPAWLFYPFIKLGARIFGGFNLEETSPIEALDKATLPIIFFHGDHDNFVPCEMSRILHCKYNGVKKLVEVKGAGHGLAYLIDEKLYLHELNEFLKVWKE
ncbi:MAG: alpha/beta fold hydrolase [Clostridia bacterium]|nr:alpha/beta fold hydrolase [Clostridia bacterium]